MDECGRYRHGVTGNRSPDVSVVILTMGNRPAQLRAAVDSALRQDGVKVEVVVVANGAPAELGIPADKRVQVVVSRDNLGIPGGRNLGAAAAGATVIAFLDDDARLSGPGTLTASVRALAAEPHLGVVALRIVDEDGGTARRHVPRIGARSAERSGPATAFLGGAAVIRRAAFERVGGYAGDFHYAMEETDLALRLVDDGWTIRYDSTPAVIHPLTDPSRHAEATTRTMRNRVWLAYRNLPAPLAVVYVANWLVISALRRPHQLIELLGAIRDGWRTRPAGQRAPIRWGTVVQLTRLGRPPIV